MNTLSKFPQSYLVAYDISRDDERNKVGKLLEGYGFRVQKSVFEVNADKRTLKQLVQALRKIEPHSGFARIYPIGYHTKPLSVGKIPRDSEANFSFVF